MSTRSSQSRRSERGRTDAARARVSAGEAPRAPRLATRARFYSRVGRAAAISLSVVTAALLAGTLGYHFIAELPWLRAFHQASLLLSGMGPVETNLRDAGRVFESIYSLFCGVILLAATGILFAPIIHRVLHRFHVEDSAER
jgi:hypothetical protein